MKIKIASRLDKGKYRENNEDSLVYCPDLVNPEWLQGDMLDYLHLGEWGSLAVIADGMGGANAGEVASSIAVQTIKEIMTPDRIAAAIDGGNDTILSLMDAAIKRADLAILQHIANDNATQGMGTTIVLCWLFNDKVHIGWCGDSRCYLYHPSRGLKPLTHDHSLVQEMVDNGELSQNEAFSHPDGNIITRGLGDFGSDAEADFCIREITTNETLLLCSDGLCGYCHDQDMEKCMDNHYTDITKCCNELLQLTLNKGGYDNISIIAISIIADEQDAPAPMTIIQSLIRQLKSFIKN